jgi:hypothetical protein
MRCIDTLKQPIALAMQKMALLALPTTPGSKKSEFEPISTK